MAPQQRQSVIVDTDWERVRPVIRQLYLREDRTLSFVLTTLKTLHNFQASKSQLEWKLKQWHIVKNMTAQQWKHVNARVVERQSLGKESSLYLSGVILEPAAVKKARSRHSHTSVLEQFNPALVAYSLPADLPLIIRTPSPDPGARCRIADIPWFQCQQLLSALTISETISPQVPNISSATNSVFRALSYVVSREPRPLLHAPNAQQIFQALSLVMPVKATEDHAYRTEGIIQYSSSRVLTSEALETIIFLLSNGFCGYLDHEVQERDNINEAILAIIRVSNTWKLLVSQRRNNLPLSLQASLDRMFEKAVIASDLITMESLIMAGVDVDLPLQNAPWNEDTFKSSRALHWAVISLNLNMVDLLVRLGTSTESVDLEMLQVICRRHRMYDETALAAMSKWILSVYEYHDRDDPVAQHLLEYLSWTPHSPNTELILHCLGPKLRKPETLGQFLITAVKTRSQSTSEWISKHSKYLDYINFLGESVLGAAVSRKEYQLCERLLELGSASEPADGAYHSVYGTPLQCAASNADSRLIRLLLDHGADVNHCQPSMEADDILRAHLRRVYTSKATHEELFGGEIGRTALQSALSSGREENALFLLARGAEQIGGELSIAIRTGQDNMITQLLAHGASLSALSFDDRPSPLESAIVKQDHDLALQSFKRRMPLSFQQERFI
ncbi:hypothetical protein HER10_EVM0006795 [Colletotrichum scovillei]|uniref:uncharacterized protein n=1 Tax=Colletotrichum scovillei TaxID=1209932 RepID=UPI0015C35D05|nr:uncharacterized protein HER10_EVM0006795 [Colletotrichum scovillei]KAF4785487.1 hypothetical protein HER10_EVM0006795 [Colletotrichum scovillei]